MKLFQVLIFTFYFSFLLNATTNYDIYIQLDNNGDIIDKINKIIDTNKDKNIKISLKKDIYHINRPLLLDHIQHMDFDGNGSTLILEHESIGFMSIKNSNDQKIENFSLDYAVLPNVAGRIISIDKQNRTIIFEPFEYGREDFEKNLINTAQKITYIMAMTAPGIMKEGGTVITFVSEISKITDNKYILSYSALNALAEDDTAVMVFRYPSPVFYIQSSKNISFNDITVYAAPSGVFVGQEASSVQFAKCQVLLKDNRYISANADVFHFQSSRKGPIIDQCVAQGVGDDIVAFYSVPMYAISQSNDSLMVLEKNFIMQKGDIIDFFNDASGTIFYSAKVENIIKNKGLITVRFNQNLPDNIDFKMLRLYDKNSSADGFVIQNSIFEKSSRYGCYLKASNGKIVGNVFNQLGGSAISIKNEPSWPEGLYSENILIQNNQMSECGYGMDPKNRMMIDIRFLKLNGLSEQKVHKNIRIINNDIKSTIPFSINNVSDFYLSPK